MGQVAPRLSRLMRQARERHVWTARHAARQLGISQGHLSQIETDRVVNIESKLILKIVEVYTLPIDVLWPSIKVSLLSGPLRD